MDGLSRKIGGLAFQFGKEVLRQPVGRIRNSCRFAIRNPEIIQYRL